MDGSELLKPGSGSGSAKKPGSIRIQIRNTASFNKKTFLSVSIVGMIWIREYLFEYQKGNGIYSPPRPRGLIHYLYSITV